MATCHLLKDLCSKPFGWYSYSNGLTRHHGKDSNGCRVWMKFPRLYVDTCMQPHVLLYVNDFYWAAYGLQLVRTSLIWSRTSPHRDWSELVSNKCKPNKNWSLPVLVRSHTIGESSKTGLSPVLPKKEKKPDQTGL